MLLTAAIELAAPGDRPRDLGLRAVALLRGQALADERTRLKLIAKGRPNSPFITEFKSRLEAIGCPWQEVVQRLFEATLTETLDFTEALDFIDNLIADRPDALTSASLSIMAEHLRWRGAPSDSIGALCLWDYKGWNLRYPKVRTSLSVGLTCRGASLEDPAFLTVVKTVAGQTGIAFDRGRFSTSHDREQGASPEVRFAIDVRLQEALARTATDIRRRGVDWRGRPGLMTYERAVNFRFEHWGAGERVSLPGPVKRLMKAEFSDFTPRSGKGLWFFKPMTEHLALHLLFDNDRLGSIGKGFTVLLGVEGTSGPIAGLVWCDSLFRIFGVDRLQPCWAYATSDDLTAALHGLASLLREVLPPFEASCRHFLDPLPPSDALLDEIERRGPLTAREGWNDALAEARSWSGQAGMIRLRSGCNLLARDTLKLGPGLDADDGRLRPHGHWSYLFRSSERPGERFVVEVPYLGSIRSSPSSGPEREDEPVGDGWLDSDRLLGIVEAIGGRAARDAAERLDDLRCELRVGRSPTGMDQRGTPVPATSPPPAPSDRWWEVQYSMIGPSRLRILSVRIDAVSGGHARVIDESHL